MNGQSLYSLLAFIKIHGLILSAIKLTNEDLFKTTLFCPAN
jgi:hypothetical protein